MFLFYHSNQKEKNATYHKGKLFEELLKKIFETLGYKIDLRQKKNSLEYDITGTHLVTSQKIIAEAKAHENTISGQDVSAFVGKLVPMGLLDKKVHGLFLSTSALSPDAEEYFNSVSTYDLKKYTGKDLYNLTCEKLKIPKTDILEKQLPKTYTSVTDYILMTDTGCFKILICRSQGNASPNCFFVFDEKSQVVNEKQFLVKLKEHISEIEDFDAVSDDVEKEPHSSGKIIGGGLTLSTDWTDYKLPAAPKYFIGRKSTLDTIKDYVFNRKTSFVQIKSRSGVGKSSLLAFLADQYLKQKYKVDIHDARDTKSTLDIFLLMQAFTKSKSLAKDFKEVHDQIETYCKSVSVRSFFFVDQFESTFFRKDIFDAYESLFNIFQKFPEKISIFIARKNDQLTTFDESKISLEKINSISSSIVLQDFDKDESVQLIKSIIGAWGSNIDKEVLEYVLEFSQGFPWLIKRTMAHILKQLNSGALAKDLITTGLKLDDLFNEELEGLDEVQMDYLSRIVQSLPANYNQLQKTFDEDPILTTMLDQLTKTRLIRLSGSTYDTYNDVLKEYILYKKLPQFKQKTLFRIASPTVIRNFHLIASDSNKEFDINKIIEILGITEGSAFNFIREWKALNLFETIAGGWKIPQIVKDVMKEGRLGDYLRREMAKNSPVSNLLNEISHGKKILETDLPKFLAEEFPFVDVSEETWITYSKCLKSWLIELQLIEVDIKTKALAIPTSPREEIINELGNLTEVKSGRRSHRDGFTPNHLYKISSDLITKLIKHPQIKIDNLNNQEKKAYSDLSIGGWIENEKLTVTSHRQFKKEASELLIEEYSRFWEAAKSGADLVSIVKEKLPNIKKDSSIKHVVKVLLSWGKNLKIIESKRYKYTLAARKRKKKATKVK